MADDQDTQTQGASDASVLNDIATNGNLLNQNISALTQAVGSLTSIVLPVTNGGTGLDHVGVGDLLVGDANNTYSLLSDIATGNALISGGVGAHPSYGKIGLTTHVSGVLPIANGGTSVSSFTANRLLATGTTPTGVFQTIGLGTAGQLFTSNGPSSLPSFQTWVDGIGGLITVPNNQTYRIWLVSPFAMTITSFRTVCTSGSCTATLSNDSGGIVQNAVSPSFVSHATSATISIGGSIFIQVSSNSSCQNFSFMIAYTRP